MAHIVALSSVEIVLTISGTFREEEKVLWLHDCTFRKGLDDSSVLRCTIACWIVLYLFTRISDALLEFLRYCHSRKIRLLLKSRPHIFTAEAMATEMNPETSGPESNARQCRRGWRYDQGLSRNRPCNARLGVRHEISYNIGDKSVKISLPSLNLFFFLDSYDYSWTTSSIPSITLDVRFWILGDERFTFNPQSGVFHRK